MVWCGYDENMEIGIRQFGHGLLRALVERSERENVTLEKLPKLELDELSTFLDQLRKQPSGPRTRAMEGLTILVHSLIEAAHERATATKTSFQAALEQEVTAIASLIEPLENRYQELASGHSVTSDERMRQLANWVSRQ